MAQESKKPVPAEQDKKPYTAPELTEHGSVEAETQTPVVRSDCSHQTIFRLVTD